MLTSIQALIKILQSLLELTKESKANKIIMMLICSIALNMLLATLWYRAQNEKYIDQKNYSIESAKKDSIFNAYLVKLNTDLMEERRAFERSIKQVDTLLIKTK